MLAVLQRADPRTGMALRDLYGRLGMARGSSAPLRRVLTRLVRDGRAIRLGRGRYTAVREPRTQEGTLRVARAGFGFVVPDPEVTPRPPDVFIPARETQGALDGDRVRCRIVKEKRDGRLEGIIDRILSRKHQILLGIWEEGTPESGWVKPLDTRLGIRVRAQTESAIPVGTVVEVEIRRFPTAGQVADGKVTHTIGPRDDPRFDVSIVCRKYGLVETFPPEVEEALARTPDSVSEADRRGREDLRDRRIFTIDPDTAKDFDDAISVEPLESGGFRVGVHIADVSHYVPEGRAIDREALSRGTSVYFPGFVVPMLPHPLSSGICSLKPDVDRLTVSVHATVDPSGNISDVRFSRSVIHSQARFTYQEAQQVLDGDEAVRDRFAVVVEPLEAAAEVARALRRVRQQRGSIELDLPEPEILWTPDGEMDGVVASDSSFTHNVIEELMLLANELVAARLSREEDTIYRIHERPNPERLEALEEDLAILGYRLEGDFLNPTPHMLQRLLSQVRGRPEERAVSMLCLRAMMLARYDTAPVGHFGLAADLYTHFTSPIRRYPDLVVHRQLIECELGGKARERELDSIAARSSERERIAQDAEREVLALKKARYMHDRLGDEYPATVLTVDSIGAWIELDGMLIDGLIPRHSLLDSGYQYLERAYGGPGGSIRLGDKLKVRVDRVDLERSFIDFSVVEKKGGRRPPKDRPRSGQPRSRRSRASDSRSRGKSTRKRPRGRR